MFFHEMSNCPPGDVIADGVAFNMAFGIHSYNQRCCHGGVVKASDTTFKTGRGAPGIKYPGCIMFKSIANNVIADAKKAGKPPLGSEGEEDGEWVLVDLGDVIVHVMQRQVREFYDLESLWRVDVSHRQEKDVM